MIFGFYFFAFSVYLKIDNIPPPSLADDDLTIYQKRRHQQTTDSSFHNPSSFISGHRIYIPSCYNQSTAPEPFSINTFTCDLHQSSSCLFKSCDSSITSVLFCIINFLPLLGLFYLHTNPPFDYPIHPP